MPGSNSWHLIGRRITFLLSVRLSVCLSVCLIAKQHSSATFVVMRFLSREGKTRHCSKMLLHFFTCQALFAVFQKATITCLDSHWTEFYEIWLFFQNLSRKFKFRWHLTVMTGTLHEALCTLMIIPHWIFLRMTKFQTFYIQYCFYGNYALC